MYQHLGLHPGKLLNRNQQSLTVTRKGCSWITLFIAMAPSLGFLGTVVGMIMAFDKIEQVGDISPTVVGGIGSL